MVYGLSQKVYNLSHYIEDSTGCDADDLRHSYLVRTIVPKLRRTNKQIKSEVEALIPKFTTFMFEESGPVISRDILPQDLPPSLVPGIQHVVFKLEAWCFDDVCLKLCDAQNDARYNFYYALEVAEDLPGLQACEIEINLLLPIQHQTLAWPNGMHKYLIDTIMRYAEVRNVATIRVYKAYRNEWDSRVGVTLWGCWNRGSGWHDLTPQEVSRGKFEL